MESYYYRQRYLNRLKMYQEHHDKCLHAYTSKINEINVQTDLKTSYFYGRIIQNNQCKQKDKINKNKRYEKNNRIDKKEPISENLEQQFALQCYTLDDAIDIDSILNEKCIDENVLDSLVSNLLVEN